ncbi:MAG: hypothetical protein IKK03_02340 [Lachnospiraceae bacterium]|nr:hypothetical protein [Lachnospiraceae bacterium]
MFYAIGFLRRTPLYGLLSLIVSVFVFKTSIVDIAHAASAPASALDLFCAFIFWSLPAYPVMVALHLFAIKISRGKRCDSSDLIEAYFSSLGADLTAPFRYVGIFLAVIIGKHKIRDDSDWHDTADFLQVLWGFIWTILMIIIIALGLIGIKNL